MAEFLDWIPDGESTGAITKNGFQDFVPEKDAITPEVVGISSEVSTPVVDAEIIDPELDIEPETTEEPTPTVKATKKK